MWRHAPLWEGWIRCCEKTRPQSFPVLLQLQAAQLRGVLDRSVELCEALSAHVRSLSAMQRTQIPRALLAELERPPTKQEPGVAAGTL